ncbi:MAG: putative heme iron utilization protein [Gammaproteobacteria bacterium]|jgi:putative heme iron utilization protein
MAKQTAPEVIRQAAELVAQMRTVQLATVGTDAAPLASYAPFVQLDGALFVYLSRLAQHAQNLHTTPRLSAMLIRDEAHCEEIFARPRLVFDCTVTVHARDGALFAAVLDHFEAQFGETASTVRELIDFSLFQLHPYGARLVSGFARAVDLGDDAMSTLFGASFRERKE